MSILGAMTTAVSGLNAQSAAFSNISDNVANSQTVGFKGTNTAFIDYLTQSNATQNQSGSVATRPDYQNEVQGSINQSTDPTALAISGQGFFAVSTVSGNNTTGAPTFGTLQEYTRAGDFTLDKNGYLVNSASEYLNGWSADANGVVTEGALAPIKVTQTQDPPTATSTVTLAANLPAGGTTSGSSQIEVYDAQGGQHSLSMAWTPTSGTANSWDLSVTVDGATTTAASGTATFDSTTGLLNGFTPSGGAGTTSGEATLSVPVSNGSLKIDLGAIGGSNGVTQFAGTSYSARSVTQDGLAAGNYSGLSIESDGRVVANYDNGASRTLAQVPVVTFANADGLQRQNGQAFTATTNSGGPISQVQGVNGAGGLVVGSTEGSNVDIAAELSKLIVAQQAYGANAKMVTTANQMLTTTIDMKQ